MTVISLIMLSFPTAAAPNCAVVASGGSLGLAGPIPLELSSRLEYRTLGFDEDMAEWRKTASSGKTGRIAIASVDAKVRFERDGRYQLDLVDLNHEGPSHWPRIPFADVRRLEFVEGTRLLAIEGRKESDGSRTRLYLFDLSTGKLRALDLPGSPHHGVGVEQILARQDLPFVLVVQDSANNVNPGGGTSILNQGLNLFDPVNLRPEGKLSFDGLVPKRAELNPKKDVVALHLVDPVVAHAPRESVVIVSLREPTNIMYRYDFPLAYRDVSIAPNAVTRLPNRVEMKWSADGVRLGILERVSGTDVIYDLNLGETPSVRIGDHIWPTAGGAFLRDGSRVLIRQGLYPVGEARLSVSMELYVHDGGRAPYALQTSVYPDLLAKNSSAVNPVREVFELRDGKYLAFVLADQIVFVERARPSVQAAFSPTEIPRTGAPLIRSVRQLADDRLQVIDLLNGVFELRIP